jgi:hypothetical protein
MPAWLRSEQMAAFDRNRWLQSSECLRVQRGPAMPAATSARVRGVVEAGLNEAAVGQEVYGR